MGPRFDGWTLQTPNAHRDSNETQLCHLQRKITHDYKRATRSPGICSNLDQQKLDVTLHGFNNIWQHLRRRARAVTCMHVTRLAWLIWGLTPKATWLLFTPSGCVSHPRPAGLHRHMYADVSEGQLKTKFWGNVKQNKHSSVWEQHQTSDRDDARSWKAADIWAEALQSWTQLRLHLSSFKCIDWLNTHVFTFLPLRGFSICYPAPLTIINKLT